MIYSMKYNSITNKTTLRIGKRNISINNYKFIKDSEIFDLLDINRLNYVFIFNGTIGKAEYELKKLFLDRKEVE